MVARRQADRSYQIAGGVRQRLFRRPQAQPPVHGREPVALRGVHRYPRRGTGLTRSAVTRSGDVGMIRRRPRPAGYPGHPLPAGALNPTVSLPSISGCATMGRAHSLESGPKIQAKSKQDSRGGDFMIRTGKAIAAGLMTAVLALAAPAADAKDKVKVGFIGPLTGGVSVNGIGGRNSADLAVRLRNADANAKYE